MYLYILNAFSIPKKKGNKLPKPYLVVKLSEHEEISVVFDWLSFLKKMISRLVTPSSIFSSKKI